MLLLYLISKLWHLKLKAMASTLRLKLLCPLHPWLWNWTLMSLFQSSLLQHPSITVLNIWGKGRIGRCWSYRVHPINIFISVSISTTRSQYQNSITFISVSISISWSRFQSLQLGFFSVSLNISLFFISGKGRRSPKCFLLLFLTTFFFSFNSEIYEKKKKKKKKEAHLTTANN